MPEGKHYEHNTDSARNPERLKIIEHIRNIYQKDLTSESIIGYHGTSIESLEFLIQNGFLPGRTQTHKYEGGLAYVAPGDLHFSPRISALPEILKKKITRQASDEQMAKDAYNYADANARAHYFIKEFGLDITSREDIGLAEDITEPPDPKIPVVAGPDDEKELQDLLHYLKCNEETLKRIIAEAQKRKGLVLGLDRGLLNHFTPKPGDDILSQDLFINCPQGLSYHFLAGLRTLGSEERRFLDNLIKQK